MHFQAFTKPRFVADQASQFRSQRIRQRIGEGGQQHPGIRIGPGQVDRPMQGNDRFAGAGRTGNPRRSVVISLDDLPLLGMEKDGPFLPGIFQGKRRVLRRPASPGSGAAHRDGQRDRHRAQPAVRPVACRRWPVPAAPRPLRRADGLPDPAPCPHPPGAHRPATLPAHHSPADHPQARRRTGAVWAELAVPPRRRWG